MESKIDPSEHAVISDLLKDFAHDPSVTVNFVYRESWQRFNAIENEYNQIAKISELTKLDEREERIRIFKALPLSLHRYMYDGLFTFAGKFRSEDDPDGGKVHFGPQKAHQYEPEFKGDSPNEIESGIMEAVSHLFDASVTDPVEAGTLFYQKFINVHPFYDGNGRIARLLSNIFLFEFGWNINWSEFDNKSKFIRLLNWCHKSSSPKAYNNLVDHIKKFTRKIDELDSVNS